MKVAILVTHLLGTGHLARALALGRALASRGVDVRVISGGRPAPHLAARAGVAVEQLAPLRSDGVAFTRLLTEADGVADEAFLAARRADLAARLRLFAPDALITELWPFGRRVLAAEFEAAIDAVAAARPEAKIYASVRDILAPASKPERVAACARIISERYHAVLVHGDAALTPLGASWPGGGVEPPAEILAKLRYTGFIAEPAPEDDGGADGRGDVIVTAGGGPVGARLFEAATAASALDDRVWRLLVGGGAARAAALRDAAPRRERLIIEPARPDFRHVLGRAACSVSQAGYNTALDVLAAGVPAVLCPFEEGGETEQRLRADALAARAGAVLVEEATLDGAALAAAVEAAIARGPLAPPALALDGARRSAEIILGEA